MIEEQQTQEISLRDLITVLQRRWWVVLAFSLGCVLVSALITLRMPLVYEATSQIQIKTPTNGPNLSALTSFGVSADTYKQTQLALLENPDVDEQIATTLTLTPFFIVVKPAVIKRALKASDRRNTDLIDISVHHTDPRIAAAIAEAAALGFRQYKDEVTAEGAKQDAITMQKRVDSAEADMDNATRKLANFEEQNNIINVVKETEGKVQEIQSIKDAEGEARQKLQAAQARIASLQAQLNLQNRSMLTYGERSDTLIDDLKTRLDNDELSVNQLQQKYVDPAPYVAPLLADISETRRRLQSELSKAATTGNLLTQEKILEDLHDAQADAAALQSQHEEIVRQLLESRSDVKDLPAKMRLFDQLSQDSNVKRDLYQKTLESLQQITMEKLAHPSVIEVTQHAILPKMPVSPKPVQNVVIGLLLGLLLGLVAALSLERLDEAVHNESDLRQLAPDMPVLGALPALSGSDLAASQSLPSVSRGPYRLVWTNIGFSALDEPLSNLVVTSAVQGEGKSLTCMYLALSAAEEGKRVILVDCDLHRPAQHRNFGVHDVVGLCEVLAGKVALDAALIQTDQPNLMLLPAGRTLPLNPAVLFKSDRMGELMEELYKRADFVLYDAPPSLVIADALLLGARCQAILQVVEAGRTSREHIKRVIDGVARARARHIGLVLNKVRRSALGYYGYYYYQSDDSGKPGMNGASSKTRRRSSGSSVR